MNSKKFKLLSTFITLGFLFFTISCGPKLESNPLPIGLLDTFYEHQFTSVSRFAGDETFYSITNGDLPLGLELSADGEIYGYPEETGLFDFEVTVYQVDYGYDGDSVSSDSDTFEIFITEPSSNANCPLPTDTTVSEIFICAGSGILDGLYVGESFDLDITYYINPSDAESLNIQTVQFSVTFDATHFEIDEENLNSILLREASSSANTDVSFDAETEGELVITLTTHDEDAFELSGRLLDIPFYATTDTPLGDYTFEVNILSVESQNADATLPDLLEINGVVSVDESEI